MSGVLTVRDESLDRRHAFEWPLNVLEERMSVRELIRTRIFEEVDRYNAEHPHSYRGLIHPVADNGQRGRIDRQINQQKQFELACEAFCQGRIVILIGDVRADDLDEEFDVAPGTTVTFLRLTLIVGG